MQINMQLMKKEKSQQNYTEIVMKSYLIDPKKSKAI